MLSFDPDLQRAIEKEVSTRMAAYQQRWQGTVTDVSADGARRPAEGHLRQRRRRVGIQIVGASRAFRAS